MFPAALTALLFALTGVCATQAARAFGGGRANFLRLLVALAALTLWAHGPGGGWKGGVLSWFLLAGAVGFGLGGWCMFQALPRLGSTLSLLTVETTSALFAGAIGWAVLGAALSPAEVGFSMIVLWGVVLGLWPGRHRLPDEGQGMAFGVVMAVTAALAQAVSFNLSRHAFSLVQATGQAIDPLTASYQRLLGGAAMALALFLAGLGISALRRPRDPQIGTTGVLAFTPDRIRFPAREHPFHPGVWVLLNALFGPVLGVACMLWAISLVANPGLVQTVAATATLISVPFARRLEKTRPAWNYYAGCAMALAGIAGLFGLLS